MDDFNQIEVPPSFLALFALPSGLKLAEPMSFVRDRYELCEDLAQDLVERGSAAQFRSGEPEGAVLRGMRQALSAEGSPVQPREARWVVRRLAELLGWEAPQDEDEDEDEPSVRPRRRPCARCPRCAW